MSLDWNISKIKNSQKVCFNTVGDDIKLAGLTKTLIFATMSIGLPVITDENVTEFFKRCHVYERVNGCWRYGVPEVAEHGPEPVYITPGEVRQHIGLRTNAERLSDHKFAEKVLNLLMTDATTSYDNFMELLKVPTPDAKDPVPKG